jgi:hypothetical protein
VGFFDDLKKLQDISAAQPDIDVKGTMSKMQAQLDTANRAMAASAPQTLDPASEARRVDAVATIVATRNTGMVVNLQPMVDIDLMVMLPSGVPIPVTTTLMISPAYLGRIVPGGQLQVTIDPTIPASVRVDWTR